MVRHSRNNVRWNEGMTKKKYRGDKFRERERWRGFALQLKA